jgi:hypothetical protein
LYRLFTVTSPLPDNFDGVVSPSQFSFSVGAFPTIATINASHSTFDIQTSDVGSIIGWTISVSQGCIFGPGCFLIATTDAGDSSSISGPTTFIGGSNGGIPGAWSAEALAAVPEPATHGQCIH